MTTRREVEMRAFREAHVSGVSEGVPVIRVDASPDGAEMIEIVSARLRPILSLVKPDVREVHLAASPEISVAVSVNRSSPDPARRRETIFQARNSKCAAWIKAFSEAGIAATVVGDVSEILPLDPSFARLRSRSAPGSSSAAAFAEAIHG
jgi:hypothetical protein